MMQAPGFYPRGLYFFGIRLKCALDYKATGEICDCRKVERKSFNLDLRVK